jgi:hypothetical protein
MELTEAQERVLRALADGIVLKGHRSIEGEKVYKLHAMDGSEIAIIDAEVIEFLKENKLVHSNMKFPAASFLLTDKGREIASKLIGRDVSALGSGNYEP